MRNRILALVAAAAVAAPSGAIAQTEEAPSSDERRLGEVVVTAQKREESLQDVPLTVTALSADQLASAGISSSRDLTLVTPGLIMAQQTLVTQPALRGVTGRGIGPGDEGTVPIYIDGVYQPVSHANSFRLSNIERIEVLKGPQGTLFGRNAVGGAINITTRDPGAEFEGRAALTYASFNRREGELYLSGPLTDTIGANISLFASADDGYIDDLLRNNKSNPASTEAVRTKVRWGIGPDTELKFTAHYAHTIDASGVALHPLNGVTSGVLFTPTIIAGEYQTAADHRQTSAYHTEGASLQFRHGFSGFDLTALSSFQFTESLTNLDTDQSPRPHQRSIIGVRDQTWTGELRAASTTEGPLQWMAGLFYFDGKGCYCDLTSGSPTASNVVRATQGSEAYALFGELTYDFTDRFSATGGLRYSEEQRSIESYRNGVYVGEGEASFENVSPRVSLAYKLNDRAQVYATYSEGFKSGVYNAGSTALPLQAVDPEVLTAYEIGLKSEPSARVRLNVSAYYYDYTDLQVSSRDVTTNLTLLQNAASAEIYGGEVQLDWAPTSQWNLSSGFAYTHAEFVDFPGANVLNNNPTGTGNVSSFQDVSGKALPKTPEITFSVRSDYTVPLAVGELTFAGNLYYSSEYYSDFHNRLTTDSSVAVNLQASWLAPSERFKVTGFVENLTDDNRPITQSAGALSDFQSEVRPRSYGVKVTYDF